MCVCVCVCVCVRERERERERRLLVSGGVVDCVTYIWYKDIDVVHLKELNVWGYPDRGYETSDYDVLITRL